MGKVMQTIQLRQIVACVIVAFTLSACAGTPKQECTGEYVDDTVITSKVKAGLLNDPQASGFAVNVETFKGIVQLSGFVKTAADRDRAHKLAHEVGGAAEVRNDILIR
jgi:osmotically-inducible protein OsmY